MENEIKISLPSGEEITGSHPVVIIGPNGSGKTTYASNLARSSNAEWISASRNIDFGDTIRLTTTEQSKGEVHSHKQHSVTHPWAMTSELDTLLAKFKAEDVASGIEFKEMYRQGHRDNPPTTKIEYLSMIWRSLFPQRVIDFRTYSPMVKADHRGGQEYLINRMSNGERAAIFLIARVIDAEPKSILIVDEPEIHFHSVLAKQIWNELEIFRSDCRFMYITHDLNFAISRNNAQFIIINSDTEQKLLPQNTGIPDEIIESILGAATFSISAKRLLFCEGSKQNKRDNELYSAWFKDEDTAIIPVGSCDEVIKCVEVFNSNEAIAGVEAVGIIDRDFRSDTFLTNLNPLVKVLPLHEIESIFCTKEIFVAFGKHLGKKGAELEELYRGLISDAKLHYMRNPAEKNKILLERVKQRTQEQSIRLLNQLTTRTDIDEVKKNYLDALRIENWDFKPENYFEDEQTKIDYALEEASDVFDFLSIFPGKPLFSKIQTTLGITQKAFIELFFVSLYSNENPDHPLSILKNELQEGLKPYSPFV